MPDPTFVPPRPYLRTTRGVVRLCASVTEGLHNLCAVSQNCVVTAAIGVSAFDLDEALDLCRRFYYPVMMKPVGPMDGFRFSFRAARVGALFDDLIATERTTP